MSRDDSTATQRKNIGERTGTPFATWVQRVRDSEHDTHGKMVAWLKTEHGFGHGDANLVAAIARQSDSSAPAGDPADAWYTGAKAPQRPQHDRVVTTIDGFGSDVEHAPKKSYLSLRRRKQFATVGPGPRGTLQIGVNLKGAELEAPFVDLGPGKMCTHQARLPLDADLEPVLAVLRQAYDAA